MSDAITEGWGFPGLSRKAHYFTGAMSLCRKWAFTGRLEADNGKPSPDEAPSAGLSPQGGATGGRRS